MKVIDLFNKIANGEEVRFRLLCDGDIFELTKDCSLYNETQKEVVQWCIDEEWLNKEVEILEEEKKIPDKLDVKLSLNDENTINCYTANNLECDLAFKINEIIDYLKSKGESV